VRCQVGLRVFWRDLLQSAEQGQCVGDLGPSEEARAFRGGTLTGAAGVDPNTEGRVREHDPEAHENPEQFGHVAPVLLTGWRGFRGRGREMMREFLRIGCDQCLRVGDQFRDIAELCRCCARRGRNVGAGGDPHRRWRGLRRVSLWREFPLGQQLTGPMAQSRVPTHGFEHQPGHSVQAVGPSGEEFRRGQHELRAAEEDLASLLPQGPREDCMDPVRSGVVQQRLPVEQAQDHGPARRPPSRLEAQECLAGNLMLQA
jgi:hypothetical protein